MKQLHRLQLKALHQLATSPLLVTPKRQMQVAMLPLSHLRMPQRVKGQPLLPPERPATKQDQSITALLMAAIKEQPL